MKCKRCSYCCTLRVKLGLFDILRIMKSSYKRREYIEKDYKGKPVIKMIKGDCFFLDRKNKKCKIYEYRPKTCKIYPSFNKDIKDCKDLRKRLN